MTIYSDTYKSKNFKKLVRDYVLGRIDYYEIAIEIANRFNSGIRGHNYSDEQKVRIFYRTFGRVEDFIRHGIKDYYRKHKDEREDMLELLVNDAHDKFTEDYKRFYRQYY